MRLSSDENGQNVVQVAYPTEAISLCIFMKICFATTLFAGDLFSSSYTVTLPAAAEHAVLDLFGRLVYEVKHLFYIPLSTYVRLRASSDTSRARRLATLL